MLRMRCPSSCYVWVCPTECMYVTMSCYVTIMECYVSRMHNCYDQDVPDVMVTYVDVTFLTVRVMYSTSYMLCYVMVCHVCMFKSSIIIVLAYV